MAFTAISQNANEHAKFLVCTSVIVKNSSYLKRFHPVNCVIV